MRLLFPILGYKINNNPLRVATDHKITKKSLLILLFSVQYLQISMSKPCSKFDINTIYWLNIISYDHRFFRECVWAESQELPVILVPVIPVTPVWVTCCFIIISMLNRFRLRTPIYNWIAVWSEISAYLSNVITIYTIIFNYSKQSPLFCLVAANSLLNITRVTTVYSVIFLWLYPEG